MNREKILEHLQEYGVHQEVFDYIVDLEKDIKILLKENERKEKVINRLNNIINELETIIKTHYIVGYEIVNNILDDILLKLKELKEEHD